MIAGQPDAAMTGIGIWLTLELRAGNVMFDVGANVGKFTLLAADLVGPHGRVYAIEPGPDNLARLRERAGSRANVRIVDAAAGDSMGVTTLFLDRCEGTRHSLSARNVGKRGEAITVRQVTLDSFSEHVIRVDVIKIDAQGAELGILRGARRMIATFAPRITLELWPFGLETSGSRARLVLDTLDALGYTVHRLSAKGILKPARFIEEFLLRAGRWNSINVTAIPRSCSTSRRDRPDRVPG